MGQLNLRWAWAWQGRLRKERGSLDTSALEALYDSVRSEIASLEEAAEQVGAFVREEMAALEQSALTLEHERQVLAEGVNEVERKQQEALAEVERRRHELAELDGRFSEELGQARARLEAEREIWEQQQRHRAEQIAVEQKRLEQGTVELKRRHQQTERELQERQAELARREAELGEEIERLKGRRGELESLELQARRQGEDSARAALVEQQEQLTKRASELEQRHTRWQEQVKDWERQRDQLRGELEHDQELLREAWKRLEQEQRDWTEAKDRQKDELGTARLNLDGQRAALKRARAGLTEGLPGEGGAETGAAVEEMEAVGAAAADRNHKGAKVATGEPTLLSQFQLLQREINRRRVRSR